MIFLFVFFFGFLVSQSHAFFQTLDPNQATRAVILGPSKELTSQITMHARQLNTYTSTLIKILDVSVGQTSEMKLLLDERPDIIVSTPGRLLAHLKVCCFLVAF